MAMIDCTCLHVVAKLKIRDEPKGLGHRNVPVRLEYHQREWLSWLNVSKDKFGENVQADLGIRDSLDDPNGQGEAK